MRRGRGPRSDATKILVLALVLALTCSERISSIKYQKVENENEDEDEFMAAAVPKTAQQD